MSSRRHTGVLLLSLLGLGVWTWVAMTPWSVELDRTVTVAVQQFTFAPLDVALSIFTIMGNIEVTAILAPFIGLALIRAGRAHLAVVLWAALIGGSLVEWIAKHWLHHLGVPLPLQHPRLNVLHHVFRTPYAYPSGHAFRTLLLASVVWRGWPPARDQGRFVSYALVALAGMMGLALVYLGDHWVSEVVGGYLLAITLIAGFSHPTSLGPGFDSGSGP